MVMESDIEQYLCRRVEELGCYCIRLSAVAGVPDRLVATMDGRCVFCEIKRGDGKLNAHQVKTQDRLKRMHHDVYTLWSVDDVDEFVNKEVLFK